MSQDQLRGKLIPKQTLRGRIHRSAGIDDYEKLRNKPQINGVELSGDLSTEDLGITEPVNADWNATDGLAKILNKPTIPAAQVNSDWNATDGVAKILNKPTIPAAQIQSDWNQTDDGVVDYIKNKPTIPAAQVNSDWEATDGVAEILNKPVIYTQDEVDDIIDGLLPVDEADGSVASFSTDLAKPLVSLKADVNAVQDLHGQDYPFPAGCGKNLFPPKEVSVSGITITLRTDGGIQINGTAASAFNATVTGTLKSGSYTLSCRFNGALPSEGAARCQIYHQGTNLNVAIPNQDNTNTNKQFTVAENLTGVEYRIRISANFNYQNVVYYPQLEKGSTMTNFVPYAVENICPIYGRNETNLYQLGGNFFNKDSESISSGSLINGSGNEVSYTDWNISDFVPVIEGARYYLYGLTSHPNTQQDNFELFDENKTKIGFANVKIYDQPYTIPSGVKYVKFSVKNPDIDTAQFGVSQNPVYCPYDAIINNVVINLGDTIYGGVLDVKNSVLSVTHSNLTLLNSLTWYPTVKQGNTCFYANLPNGIIKTGGEQLYSGLCETYRVTNDFNMSTNNSVVFYCSSLYGGYTRVLIRDDSASTMTGAEFKEYVSGKILYPINTPIEIPLSDIPEIVTLIGTNNIFADSGDVEVKYKKSIQKYIDDKIAETQALIL